MKLHVDATLVVKNNKNMKDKIKTKEGKYLDFLGKGEENPHGFKGGKNKTSSVSV